MLKGTGNNLRYVDLIKMHAELGQLICQSLPGYHVITGCDFNVYNSGNVIDVDAARLQMFNDLYTISDVNEAFDRKKLRNFDASNVPPCKRELFQQFLRANYACTIWNKAYLKNPATYIDPKIIVKNNFNSKILRAASTRCWALEEEIQSRASQLKESDIDDNQAADWSSTNEDKNIDDNDLDTLREDCGIIRKQASTDGGVLWKVVCVNVVQVRRKDRTLRDPREARSRVRV
ncbi:uncharacterized protein TNCV_2972221 [Trichonephila clavipes]|nr:uncharacterized protein TNCV_2972221 [Trichonephila clavipes]